MVKWMINPSIVLLALIMITTMGSQAQSISSSTAGSISTAITEAGIAASENNPIKILGIDPTAFPKVKVNVFINKSCAMAGNLRKENFKVKENGNDVAIDNIYFTGNASGQMLDLAVIFDDTASMGPYISAMKAKVKDLTDKIKASGMDANYSLVSFKDGVSVKTQWTNDPAVFKKSVDALYPSLGDDEPEDALDAIEAVLSMGFRHNAQRVILVITDAHAHYKDDDKGCSKYTKEQVEKDLKTQGVIFVPVSTIFGKPDVHVDLRNIANDIQSMWIDMGSADFSVILEQFKGILTGNYVIEYTSPDWMPSGDRDVSVTVDAPECVVGTDSSSYITPGSMTAPTGANNPPVVNDLTSDKASPQEAGTVINWNINAADPDGDKILYRFFLNDKPVTDWIIDSTWKWTTSEADIGSNRIEV